MLPSNAFLCLLSGSLASAASEITNIKYSNLSISPLTAQRYPSEGWQATFDFDISDASSIAVGDYFTLSLPYVYRIKLGGSSGSESMIINLANGSPAFKCSVTQQAAYLYQDSILTCEALMSFSDYSSLAGQLSFSVNFDAGGSVYKYELEDASFFKAGGMQVPFGSQMSTEVVFDKVPLPDYYYTFGRTTGYGTAQIYYLDMFCPNGYLLGGTETINFDNRNGGFNIDCSSLQTYLSKNFNDFLLPLDVESNTPDNICYGNTVQVTVNNAGEGAMLFINVLQDVHDGDQSIEHSISIHYSCMDTLAHTTYTTDVDRLYVYDIYNGADSGTITATQSITASSMSTTSSSSSSITSTPSSTASSSSASSSSPTFTSSSRTSSSSASSSPSPVTSRSVASAKSSSTSSSSPLTTPSSSIVSIRHVVATTPNPSFVKSLSSTSSTTELLTSSTITSSRFSTSSIPPSTTIASTTPASSTTVFTLSTTPNMRTSPSSSSPSSSSSATTTSSTPVPIAISRFEKSSVRIPFSVTSPTPSSLPTYSVSSTLPLSTSGQTNVTNTPSSSPHSETLAATSLVPTSSTSVQAIRQFLPSPSSHEAVETPETMKSTATATSSNPESPKTSLTATSHPKIIKFSSSNVPLVPVAATVFSTILASSPVTQSASSSSSQTPSSIKMSESTVPSSTHPAVRSEIAQPGIIISSSSFSSSHFSTSQVVVDTATYALSSEFTSFSRATTVDSILNSSSKSTSSMVYIMQKSVAHSAVLFSQANVATTPTADESAASFYSTTSDDIIRVNNKPVQETSESNTLVVVTITSNGAAVSTKEATEQTHITSGDIGTTENVSPASVSTVIPTDTPSRGPTETSTSVVMGDESANTMSVDAQTLDSTTELTLTSGSATTVTTKPGDSATISSKTMATATSRIETTGSVESVAPSSFSHGPSSLTTTEGENTHSQTKVFTENTPTTILQQADTVSSTTQTTYATLMTSAVPDTSFEPLVPAFTGLGSRLHVSVFPPVLLISILSFFLM